MLKIQFKDKRKPAMWLVDSTIKIGSEGSCDIVIGEQMVDPIHVELVIQNNEITLKNVSTKRSVFINDMPIIKQQLLKAWDVIKVGQSELEIIDPLSERSPPPVKTPAQATVIRPAVTPWMLKAESAPLEGQYFSVANGFIIGRDDKADIKLPFNYVSRQHLKLSIRNEKLFLEDMDSSNGTFVNSKQITSCEAANGDELRLDRFKFTIIGPEGISTSKVSETKSEKPTAIKPVKSKSATNNSALKNIVASQKVFLHGISPEVNGKVIEIDKTENHISRLLGHHLSTSEKSVSARHVYLIEKDLGWEIKNDGASDGLFVNGKMQSRVILQEGDEVIVGGTILRFQCVGEQPLNYATPAANSSVRGLKVIVLLLIIGAAVAGVFFSGLIK